MLVVIDGGKGLEVALASLWAEPALGRAEPGNLLAHAPKHLHDEIKADFNDMVHAKAADQVLSQRKLFLAKWRLRCRQVAKSLEEAGLRLFTSCPNSGARSGPRMPRTACTRSSNGPQEAGLLPCAETAAMLFWALLASGQITLRRVDGWPTLDRSPTDLDLDLD